MNEEFDKALRTIRAERYRLLEVIHELVRLKRREELGELDQMDHDTMLPLAWQRAFDVADGEAK